ncbi:hypothetical protein T492DRAFT_1062604 [Pavlovales sp. CCMP2436]|nr:hypothetical protein T492DRAFT_1062604 [Pavlovales sp. CCMP2436]
MSFFRRSRAESLPPVDASQKRGFSISLPKFRGGRKSDANTLALDSDVTAEDLAPTSAAKEEGGDATQGDFLMAAKARRQKLAEQGRNTSGESEFHTGSRTPMTRSARGSDLTGGGGSSGLCDIDVPQVGGGGGLRDIDVPQAGGGGGLSDVDVPKPR